MINAVQGTGLGRSAAVSGAGGAGSTGEAGGDGDFASILSSFASQTIDTIRGGEAAATAGLTGAMPVQEVVDKVMAAEQALQSAIAVRDKIVAAYLEISRMPI
jgi:flagellar hook-basal body complex protein FliE